MIYINYPLRRKYNVSIAFGNLAPTVQYVQIRFSNSLLTISSFLSCSVSAWGVRMLSTTENSLKRHGFVHSVGMFSCWKWEMRLVTDAFEQKIYSSDVWQAKDFLKSVPGCTKWWYRWYGDGISPERDIEILNNCASCLVLSFEKVLHHWLPKPSYFPVLMKWRIGPKRVNGIDSTQDKWTVIVNAFKLWS